MIGQSQSGHGQGPRPWSRSKAMVKFQSEAERMSTWAAAAASAGGSGSGGQRAGARGSRAWRALWGKPRFFSVSSNPGRGGKIFFFEKAWKFFFSGRSE